MNAVCPICDEKQEPPGTTYASRVQLGGDVHRWSVCGTCADVFRSHTIELEAALVLAWRALRKPEPICPQDAKADAPPCPGLRTNAFQKGWAAFHSCEDEKLSWDANWYAGWREAEKHSKAAKADAPPCPDRGTHTLEYEEGWDGYFQGVSINLYGDTVLTVKRSCWHWGWQAAESAAKAAKADKPAEQPEPALPRVIWTGVHASRDFDVRVVQVAGDRFTVDRKHVDSMGVTGWEELGMVGDVANTLAFGYLRKLAGEVDEKTDAPQGT